MGKEQRRAPSGAAVLREELTDSISAAVLEELAAKGYQRLAMDAVARRAGVGKSAIYRRWPAKLEMVVDVLAKFGVPAAEPLDTGSLRGDIRALLGSIRIRFEDPILGPIFADISGMARTNEELGKAISGHVSEPRRVEGRRVLERAIARGEVPADTDLEVVLDFFGAPLFWRLHVRRVPITEEYLDQLADLLVKTLS